MPLNKYSKRFLPRNRKSEEKEVAPPEKSSLLTTFIMPTTLALLALIGTIWTAFSNNQKDLGIADKKFQSDMVLKALESPSGIEQIQKLSLLINLGLLKDEKLENKAKEYVFTYGKNPDSAVQIKFPSDNKVGQSSEDERIRLLTLLADLQLLKDENVATKGKDYLLKNGKTPISTAPVNPSPSPTPEQLPLRIYLLSGKKINDTDLDKLKSSLTYAGFPILVTKSLVDPGRPDTPEIRYFNEVDKSQAEKIAKFMQPDFQDIPVNKYQDSSAKPGYIEIWLGR